MRKAIWLQVNGLTIKHEVLLHYLLCLCRISPLFRLPVYKHFIIRILCTTNSLKDTAFRCMHLPSKCCLPRSLLLSVFCFSLSISLMLSLHMCSGRTKLLISHPRCSKPSAQKRCRAVCACACLFRAFQLPFWLQTGSVGTEILRRSLKSGTGSSAQLRWMLTHT